MNTQNVPIYIVPYLKVVKIRFNIIQLYYAKPNVVIFSNSILIQFNIYLFNSVRICSIQSLHSFNLIRVYSI